MPTPTPTPDPDEPLPFGSLLLGLVAPAPIQRPFGFPPPEQLPPPELPTSPAGQIALIALGAAAAISILVPKQPKKQKWKEDPKPNNKVLKLKDAFEVVDKIVTGRQIGWAVLKFLKANVQAFGHPSWISADEAFAEIGDEVTDKLKDDLKNALVDKVLQQKNPRYSSSSHFLESFHSRIVPPPIRRTWEGDPLDEGSFKKFTQNQVSADWKMKPRVGGMHRLQDFFPEQDVPPVGKGE